MVQIAPPTPGFEEFVACPRDLVRSPLVRAFLDAAQTVSNRMETHHAAR